MSANRRQYPPPASGQPLLVGHLMASAPPRTRGANAASTAFSLLAHAAILALAFSITTDGGRGAPKPPGMIDISLPPDPPAPQLPKPIQVDVEPTRAPAPVGPVRGTLVMPTLDPTEIPPPSPVPPTDESLFSDARGTDVGSTRPTGGSATQPAGDPAENPGAFVPMSVAPELTNRSAVERALQRLYPAMLRDAGFGGQVVVWVYVDETGGVLKAVVRQSSGHPQLDAAALQVARVMRFSPALNHDQRVKVWVSVPVQFRAGD